MYQILDFLFLFYFFPLFYSSETGFFSVYPSISTVTSMYQHAWLSLSIFDFFLWLYHTILKKCLLYEAKSNEQKTELFEYVYAKGILEY